MDDIKRVVEDYMETEDFNKIDLRRSKGDSTHGSARIANEDDGGKRKR